MRRTLLMLLTAAAFTFGACGGDDEDDVEQTVRDFVSASSEPDPETLCGELVSQEFLEQATGATGDEAEGECRRQLEDTAGVKAELVEIRGTEIDGERATVRALIRSQGRERSQVLRLEKEDGRWKLAGGGP